MAPETRSRIPRIRALGYAGYLIKPLRRASLEARALAALAPRASPGAEVAPVTPIVAEDERLRPAATPVGLRVLLAEDNPVNAMLATILLKHAGCQVDRAGGGVEAVAMAGPGPLRPDPSGSPHARHGWADGRPAPARGRDHRPHRGSHRQRLRRGSPGLPGGGHGRLPHQAAGAARP